MFTVIIPTLNAAKDWQFFAPSLLACARPEQVLLMDSESTDGTPELARAAGFRVSSVRRAEFNHGGTRQMAADMVPDVELLVYMTQDAVLVGPDALDKLLAPFSDPLVAAVCGRQLPKANAEAIEAHARHFNYPATSEVRNLASKIPLGIRAAFLSNSLAAYRRSALMQVGGFPANVIFGEDMVTAARLLKAGYKVAYAAEACVYHSHEYTKVQEFRRYFDIGVLHRREHWLLDEFGKADGEGMRFVRSEFRYLLRHDVGQIPSALLRTFLKLLGYRLGLMEVRLSPRVKQRLSMHPRFWT
jgi:rhamnosyltransferase